MANGQGPHDLEAVWRAVDGLREQLQRVSERTAILDSQQRGLAHSIDNVEQAVLDSETRMNARFDRMRNWAIALVGVSVPIVSALIGAIVQSGP